MDCYAQAKKDYSVALCKAFAQGCGGRVRYDLEPNGEPSLVSGMDADRRRLMNALPEYWQADHGYFRRGEYFRVTHNGLWCDGTGEPDERRLQTLGIRIAPIRRNPRYILLCVQSPQFYEIWRDTRQTVWMGRMTAQIRKYTNRPIEVRMKPPGSMPRGMPLMAQIRYAHAVVCDSSAVALEALALGCPVHVTDESYCAARLNTPLHEIEDAKAPDQDEARRLLAVVAANQWTLDEMRSGQCWSELGNRRRDHGLGPRQAQGRTRSRP